MPTDSRYQLSLFVLYVVSSYSEEWKVFAPAPINGTLKLGNLLKEDFSICYIDKISAFKSAKCYLTYKYLFI